jgi:hypothetical protein
VQHDDQSHDDFSYRSSFGKETVKFFRGSEAALSRPRAVLFAKEKPRCKNGDAVPLQAAVGFQHARLTSLTEPVPPSTPVKLLENETRIS